MITAQVPDSTSPNAAKEMVAGNSFMPAIAGHEDLSLHAISGRPDLSRLSDSPPPKFIFKPNCFETTSYASPDLHIDDQTLGISYASRNAEFAKRLIDFAHEVECSFPDNVQVTFSISPWGGNAATDDVTIDLFDHQGSKVATDSYFRSVNDFETLGIVSGAFVPQWLRDTLFLSRIRKNVDLLQSAHERDPLNPTPLNKELGRCVGLW